MKRVFKRPSSNGDGIMKKRARRTTGASATTTMAATVLGEQTAATTAAVTVAEVESNQTNHEEKEEAIATTMTTTATVRRGNRKSKRDWRKNVDLTDVEESLEEQRKEELSGGPLSERPDDALFVIDRQGKMSQEQRRQKKQMKIDVILQPNKYVKPLLRRAVSQAKFVPADAAKIERMAEHLRRQSEAEKKKRKTGTTGLDLDMAKQVVEQWNSVSGSSLEKGARGRRSAPEGGVVEGAAIATIHPGSSYNPHPKQHRDLVRMAAEEQLQQMRKEGQDEKHRVSVARMRRADGSMKVDNNNNNNSHKEEDGDAGEEEADAETTKPPPFKRKPTTADNRKTKAERNRKSRNLRAERRVQRKKVVRKKMHDLNRVKSLAKEISKEETQKARLLEEKKERAKQAKQQKPPRLGPVKYAPPSLLTEVKLPGSLPGSFRALTTEGNLLRDRYLRMQQRSIIEPRMRAAKMLPRFGRQVYNKRYRDLDPDFQ